MTKIEWCDETLNPITGCTPISPGCKNCYAARMAKRLAGRCGYPETAPFRPGVWHENQYQKISKVPGRDKRVFVGSMGDLFHPANQRLQIRSVIRACGANGGHQFLFLTKRPDTALDILTDFGIVLGGNIWFGATAENQTTLDARLPDLRKIPACNRFLSVEPMLGQITLPDDARKFIDWIICGAETGPGARMLWPEWADDLFRQCLAQNIPFFFKKPSKSKLLLPRCAGIREVSDPWPPF